MALLVLLFFLDVKWVFPSIVGETLSSCHGTFVAEKCRKVTRYGGLLLCAFFGPFRRGGIVEHCQCGINGSRFQNSFLCSLLLWARKFLDGALCLY